MRAQDCGNRLGHLQRKHLFPVRESDQIRASYDFASRTVPRLYSTLDLAQPPANPDEQKAPVLEKLGPSTLNRMAGKLEDPTNRKERQRDLPESANERRKKKERKRNRNHRDAQRMERAVHRMFVALFVLVDPFFHRLIAENQVRIAHTWLGTQGL
jgi:hypothetical protein